MHRLSRRFLSTGFVLLGLLPATHRAHAQSYDAVITLPDGDLLMVGDKDDVPIMSLFTTAWAVQPNPEGTPVKGEFTAACADAAGNLFLAYIDKSNPKKEVTGLLRRVNGSWAAMPKLPKGWSAVYDPVAAGPDALWFRSWHSEERRSILAYWNGTAYTALPLPEAMKELHTLYLDTDGALLADGKMDKDAGVYRYADGNWQPMGGAMDGLHVDRIVRLSNDDLVCNVHRGAYSSARHALYRWNKGAWEPLKGAEVAPKRDVEDLCTGPDGRLYLLIEASDEEGDPQRLACWLDGTLRWYKGTEENAVQRNYSGTINLYQLACDRTGLLHARDYSKQHTFPWADFDRATDGYTKQDADAAAVWALFQRLEPDQYTRTGALLAAYRGYSTAHSAANTKQVSTANAAMQAWAKSATDSMERVAPKGTNRLADRFVAVLGKWRAAGDAMVAEGKTDLEFKEDQLQRTATLLAQGQVRDAQEVLEAELEAYPKRNALAPRVLPASWATRDGYPAKDERAAEVYAAQQAHVGEWNAYMAASDGWATYIGRGRSASTGHAIISEINATYRPWLESERKRLEALAMPPDRNRLHDAFMSVLLSGTYLLNATEGLCETITGSYTNEIYNDSVERFNDAHREVNMALAHLRGVLAAYVPRNGL